MVKIALRIISHKDTHVANLARHSRLAMNIAWIRKAIRFRGGEREEEREIEKSLSRDTFFFGAKIHR